MSDMTIVTTCMGRLDHLRQTLPPMIAQAGAGVIVVDYACPDHCGAWVAEHYPDAVTVVPVRDASHFNVSRARNAGAAAASAEWLCFCDADTLLAPAFLEQLAPRLRAGRFYIAAEADPSLRGTLVCRREDFWSVDGYDTVMEGWGHEDTDLYKRLSRAGLQWEYLPQGLLTPLDHDDGQRVENHLHKHRELSQLINVVYSEVKQDLLRERVEDLRSEDRRRELYGQIRTAILGQSGSGKEAVVRIPLAGQQTLGGAVRKEIVYRVER